METEYLKLLTLVSQVPFTYSDKCGVQREAKNQTYEIFDSWLCWICDFRFLVQQYDNTTCCFNSFLEVRGEGKSLCRGR